MKTSMHDIHAVELTCEEWNGIMEMIYLVVLNYLAYYFYIGAGVKGCPEFEYMVRVRYILLRN